MGGQENADDVSQADPHVDGGEVVHLCWRPQQGDGRHEGGQQRHGHGDEVHVASRHQKVLHTLLVAILSDRQTNRQTDR